MTILPQADASAIYRALGPLYFYTAASMPVASEVLSKMVEAIDGDDGFADPLRVLRRRYQDVSV